MAKRPQISNGATGVRSKLGKPYYASSHKGPVDLNLEPIGRRESDPTSPFRRLLKSMSPRSRREGITKENPIQIINRIPDPEPPLPGLEDRVHPKRKEHQRVQIGELGSPRGRGRERGESVFAVEHDPQVVIPGLETVAKPSNRRYYKPKSGEFGEPRGINRKPGEGFDLMPENPEKPWLPGMKEYMRDTKNVRLKSIPKK